MEVMVSMMFFNNGGDGFHDVVNGVDGGNVNNSIDI